MAATRSLLLFLLACLGSIIYYQPWHEDRVANFEPSFASGHDAAAPYVPPSSPLPPPPPPPPVREPQAPAPDEPPTVLASAPAQHDAGDSSSVLAHLSGIKVHQIAGTDKSNLIPFLIEKGLGTDKTLLFSFAWSYDVEQMQNLPFQLARGGKGGEFVVFCLDAGCMAASGFAKFNAVGWTLTELRLTAQRVLAAAGYNFIFLDASIVLTGTLDPFAFMLPLTDDTWDLQFLPDDQTANSGISTGWYWARPTLGTVKYFETCEARWKETARGHLEIMNEVGRTMQNDRQLKLKLLPWHLFKSWAHYTEWEMANMTNTDAISELLASTVLIHLSCVDRSLQPYFNKLLSGYGDINGYYTKSDEKFIGINCKSLNGNARDIPLAITFIAMAALDLKRTFIFPEYVDLTQMTDEGERRIRKFPTWRLIDPSTLPGPYVEGRYVYNHQRYSNEKFSEETLTMQYFSRRMYSRFSDQRIVYIDMELGGDEWKRIERLDKFVNPVKNTMSLCKNVNEATYQCNAKCTRPPPPA